MRTFLDSPHLKRLVACLFGGFVLALMVGDQEGSQTDFGVSFSDATSTPRLLVFLALGVVVFAIITFSDYVTRYARRPGALPLGVAVLALVAGQFLMNWYDPVGKYGKLSDAVAKSSGVPAVANAYFSFLGWTLLALGLVLGAAAVITRIALIGYAQIVVGVAGAVLAYVAHSQVVSLANGIDHSLGSYATVIGFLLYAVVGLVAATSSGEVAAPRVAIEKTMGWRPGLPLAVVGLVFLLEALFSASWFAPLSLNLDLAATKTAFQGTGLKQYALTYLNFGGIILAVVAMVVALVASYLSIRWTGWIVLVLGLAGVVYTFFSLQAISRTGSIKAPTSGRYWQNLGAGGWAACIGYSLIGICGYLIATKGRSFLRPSEPEVAALPLRAANERSRRSQSTKAILPVAIALALFYPVTLPLDWQSTLVTQIGPYILLAVGLNVVVGWAGLLDLGYVAFYGIGSYTTAYLTGSLPLKPPFWLDFFHSPLWAIPFAVAACLVAGVLLGAPTLRLRGDYLAIVTLGFGEIIQLLAINNPGNLTGGPRGPSVPNPMLKIGDFHITWGLDSLPYWYLLLVFLVIVVVLFYRLEGSRLGRAWAAIREDEVAAQATGINTTKAKLLAFAIGASTSGLAGVFFATQVGYFDPSQFVLQNSILIVAYVVFGGMGSLPGAIAGAAVLTWLPQFLKSQVPLADRQMWIGLLVLLMMIFRPAGLLPARRRAAELHDLDEVPREEPRVVPAGEGL